MSRLLVRNSFTLLASVLLLWLAYPGGAGWWPAVFMGFVPLLFFVQLEPVRQSLFWGLAWGTMHFIVLLYWIVNVLGHYGGLPLFLSVPALILLALYMGCYGAIFVWGAKLLCDHCSRLGALFLIPALWVGLDWLRSFLFSGFPWMDPGYSLWQVPVLLQIADVFGHHGLSYGIVFINCAIFLLFKRGDRERRLQVAGAAMIMILCVGIYSTIRWKQINQLLIDAPHVSVGVVQGNIDQSVKWSPNEQASTISAYLSLSRSLFDSPEKPELIVWPETALPFFPERNALFDVVLGMAQTSSIYLLTGSPWFTVIDQERREVELYNSAVMISPQGEVADRYSKSHLVPFGEYVPLKRFLFFLKPLVEAVGDFTPGRVEHPLRAGQIMAGTLICFESIFPDIARKWIQKDANLLVNLTNDAWYGRSSAPHQSLAMTTLRAVESRRSIVRSANTGISAFIDPVGRLLKSSKIFVPWAVEDKVALLEVRTVYVRYGYLFAPLCAVVALIGLGGGIIRRKRKMC